jgi:hypothetical protein
MKRDYVGPEKRRYVRVDIVTVMHMVVFDAEASSLLGSKELVKLRSGIMAIFL